MNELLKRTGLNLVNSLYDRASPMLLEHPGLPLPRGARPAGTIPEIVVGTGMPHPSDVVELLVRREGGAPRRIRASRGPMAVGDPVQWFRATLPELAQGIYDEYRVELKRAGHTITTLPVDGSWRSLVGADIPPTEAPAPVETGDTGWPSRPRFGYELEFFAALTVNLRAEVVGATPEGYRMNFFFRDGRVIGPDIDSVVNLEGGDWMCIRKDGIGVVHITISYRTSDGALLLEQSGGVFDLGPDGYARAAAGNLTGSPPLYATPTWSTAHPQWQWLNRCQGFGIGRVILEKLQVHCDIYIPRVGDWLAHG